MMTKDKLRQLTGDERLGQMRESEYLGAEDIDDGVEPILTISGLWNGTVTLQRGRENKDVLTFVEERVPGIMQVRPLIINSTNRKTLRKLYGDAKASTLVGKQIQLYIDHNVRDPQDGGITDGIAQWTLSKKSDDVFNDYRREYKKRFARMKAGKLSSDEFYAWSKAAREVKAACEAGEITQDKFKAWLELM